MEQHHHKIHYVELAAHDLEATKAFFSKAFGWGFQAYGPDYVGLKNVGLDGGFYRKNLKSNADAGGALVILYSSDLEATQREVEGAGGQIKLAIFPFPGGRRFHFLEPSGNEFAVWTDKDE